MFPETETARQPRISAASDAAALRFRRGDDALGVPLPGAGQTCSSSIFPVLSTATALEYVTGAVMERLFKVRYWDYSSQPFQLHGYICLSSSIAWGFLTILMTDVIHNPIARTVLAVLPVILLICDFVISVLFTADAYESIKAALALGHTLEAMTKLKADIEELQSKIELLREEAIERGALTREETAEKLAAAGRSRPQTCRRPQ